MVIACVMEFLRQHGDEIGKFSRSKQYAILDTSEVNQDESDRERFLRGDYKIILQLISVLPHGKLSKLLVDRAIDTCQHIQDIRGAIVDFKLRLQPLEVGSKKYESIFKVGVNYLVRYFYLITFTDYLLERNNTPGPEKASFPLFSEWLADRREIVNIVQSGNQDFS